MSTGESSSLEYVLTPFLGGHIDNPNGAGIGFMLGMVRGDATPGINKDSLDCGFSPHAHLHMAAVNASIKATVRYVDDIKQNLNETQLRMLFGTGSTLAFAVDLTSIFKPITASIKSHTIKIVEEDLHIAEEKEANRYVVRAFNSGSHTVTTQTSDIGHFKSTVNDLGIAAVRGRDSCAGLSLSGILDTLKELEDGSTLFLMAGAYPPDDSLATEVISLAYAKDITMHSFHYRGGCVNDYVRLRASFKMKSVYDSFAAATGGVSYGQGIPQLQLSQMAKLGRVERRGDAFNRLHVEGHNNTHSAESMEAMEAAETVETMHTPKISTELQASIQNKGDGSPILKIADAFTRQGQKSTYSFPVDNTINDVKIALVSKSTSITIIQPNGSPLPLPANDNIKIPSSFLLSSPGPATGANSATSSGSSTTRTTTNNNNGITSTLLENGHFITLTRPTLGTWKIIVNAAAVGDFKLDVYATTTLHLHSFQLSKLEGRGGHEGYYPVLGDAIDSMKIGDEVSLVAEMRGPFRTSTSGLGLGMGMGWGGASDPLRFEYRDVKGNVLLAPGLKSGSGKAGEANVNLFFGSGRVGGSSRWSSVKGRYLVYVVGKDESGRDFQRVWGSEVVAVG